MERRKDIPVAKPPPALVAFTRKLPLPVELCDIVWEYVANLTLYNGAYTSQIPRDDARRNLLTTWWSGHTRKDINRCITNHNESLRWYGDNPSTYTIYHCRIIPKYVLNRPHYELYFSYDNNTSSRVQTFRFNMHKKRGIINDQISEMTIQRRYDNNDEQVLTLTPDRPFYFRAPESWSEPIPMAVFRGKGEKFGFDASIYQPSQKVAYDVVSGVFDKYFTEDKYTSLVPKN